MAEGRIVTVWQDVHTVSMAVAFPDGTAWFEQADGSLVEVPAERELVGMVPIDEAWAAMTDDERHDALVAAVKAVHDAEVAATPASVPQRTGTVTF